MAFPTTSILDNFNRANGALGANWTSLQNSHAVSSNQIVGSVAGAVNVSEWNTTYTADSLEAYVTIIASASHVRFYLLNASSQGYYLGCAGANSALIYKCDLIAATETSLASNSTDFAGGDSLGVVKNGSSLAVYRKPSGGAWGASPVLSTTDASYSGCNRIVFFSYSTVPCDDFGGGTIVAASAKAPVPWQRKQQVWQMRGWR